MAVQSTEPEYTELPEGESTFTRPDGRTLPMALDSDMTMEVVQRYVDAERRRSRKVLLWSSTIFLFVLLAVLVVFVSVGLVVLRNSRKTKNVVDHVEQRTAAVATQVAGVAGEIGGLKKSQDSIREVVEDQDVRRARDNQVFRLNLERFGHWVSTHYGESVGSIPVMETRLAGMEAELTRRERELAEIRRKYAELEAAVAKVEARPVPVNTRSNLVEDALPPIGDAVETGPVRPPALPPEVHVEMDPLARAAEGKKPVTELELPNGDRYEGETRDGKMEGWGIYTFVNGDRYEGQFLDNRISGKGTMSYQNGNRYSGDFKSGMKHGNGVFTFANGDVYRGEFRDNQREGRGTYVFADGAKYFGEFHSGRRHGKGKYVYAGGAEYVGEFRNGRKHGYGVCIYPNGVRVKGIWKDDRLDQSLED